MKIPKYFNRKITAQCEYCHYCKTDDKSVYICTINRSIRNEKCSKFIYDPLMRIPETSPELVKIDPEELTL